MVAVRDFIYVDVERLKSLYSQVFEGVVDQIVQTEVDEHQTDDTQKGGILHSGSTTAEKIAEASYKTESRILYDHMYNLLEEKLDGAIVEATELSRENYINTLEQAFMIKVKGAATVADFERIKIVMDDFNKIVKAFDYVSTYGKRHELEEIKGKLWAQVKAEKDRNKKSKLQSQIKKLEKKLKESGNQLDDTFLEYISYITNMFCSDVEVTIHPTEEVVFRAVLDRQWLRVSTDFLRSLYGGYPAPNWTMVGQLTYLPSTERVIAETDASEAVGELNEDINSNDGLDTSNVENEPGSMRDAYRTLMAAYQDIEKTFTDSNEYVEVIIWPLAIYRETMLTNVKDNSGNEETA